MSLPTADAAATDSTTPGPVLIPPATAVERESRWRLDHDLTAPSTARHRAHGVLTDWGLADDAVDDALLVLSELVSNAVEHALPPLDVCLCLESHRDREAHGRLRIGVTDGGAAHGSGRRAVSLDSEDSEHGRGITLIEALSSDSGRTDITNDLVKHWATVEAAPRAPLPKTSTREPDHSGGRSDPAPWLTRRTGG